MNEARFPHGLRLRLSRRSVAVDPLQARRRRRIALQGLHQPGRARFQTCSAGKSTISTSSRFARCATAAAPASSRPASWPRMSSNCGSGLFLFSIPTRTVGGLASCMSDAALLRKGGHEQVCGARNSAGAPGRASRSSRATKSAQLVEMVTRMAKIGRASSPTFSPDGTRLAFVSDQTGVPQVWVTNGSMAAARAGHQGRRPGRDA